MDSFNALTAQPGNTAIVLLIMIAAAGGLWYKLRDNPRLTRVAIYTGLAIWLLSLLAAFIWQI